MNDKKLTTEEWLALHHCELLNATPAASAHGDVLPHAAHEYALRQLQEPSQSPAAPAQGEPYPNDDDYFQGEDAPLRKALQACRDKFAEYVAIHTGKGTISGEDKALKNQAMVDMCDAVLAETASHSPVAQDEDERHGDDCTCLGCKPPVAQGEPTGICDSPGHSGDNHPHDPGCINWVATSKSLEAALKKVSKVNMDGERLIFWEDALPVLNDYARQSQPPVLQGLEEIASRIYLEKFTRKDDPDVIGAAIVSYGIDVLTNYARQSEDRVAELETDNKRLSLDYEEYRNELPKQMAHQASKLRQQLHVQLNAAEERVAELERENGILRSTKPITFKGVDKAIARAEAAEAALRAACHELDRLIAKYVCWNSACKDESHVQIKAKVAELRGETSPERK